MFSKDLMIEREMLASAIYSLLDEYYRYGHLYDEKGELKAKYKYVWSKEDGLLYDSDGKALDYIPDKYDQDYDWALDVHSCEAMGEFSYDSIIPMKVEEIIAKYLGRYMDKLVAMLLRGKNYAINKPIPKCFGRKYIEQNIAITWKLMVVNTLDCIDFKRKLKGMQFAPQTDSETHYVWDDRHFTYRLYGKEDEIEVPGPIHIFDEGWESRAQIERERRLERQEQVHEIIERSYSDEDKAKRAEFINAIQEAFSEDDGSEED